MQLEVFNEHVTGLKKHVGIAVVKLKDIWPYKNVTYTNTVDLVNNNSKKIDKSRGVAIIKGKVIDNRSVFDECVCNIS